MLNKHNYAIKKGQEKWSDFTLHCFMCGRELRQHEQVISMKGFRCGPKSGYSHIMWVHEDCAHDLQSLLKIDLKKLDALRLYEAKHLAEKEN